MQVEMVTRRRVLRGGIGALVTGALATCGTTGQSAPARSTGPVTVTYLSVTAADGHPLPTHREQK